MTVIALKRELGNKMDLKITKEVAEYNNSPYGNKKACVVVRFPNCVSTSTLKPFKWFPTYQQLEEIKQALFEIEDISWKTLKK